MKFPNLRNRKADAPAVRSSNDLGLGDKVARQPGTRLINDDGSFNVVRKGRSIFAPTSRW